MRAEKWRRSKGIMPPKPKAPEYIRLAKRTAAQRKWREENPEAMKLARAEWAAANPHKAAEICRARQARKAQACPAWVDREALAKFYKLARDMTRETGVKHCVDHIVPLKNKIVCGLHVPANLQVITVSENARKGNSFVES